VLARTFLASKALPALVRDITHPTTCATTLLIHIFVRFAISKSDRARPAPQFSIRAAGASGPRPKSPSVSLAIRFAPNRRSAAFRVCFIDTLPAKAFAGVRG
jgi:hypothetical protein